MQTGLFLRLKGLASPASHRLCTCSSCAMLRFCDTGVMAGGCNRSNSTRRETPAGRWYFVLRRGRRVLQVCKAQHISSQITQLELRGQHFAAFLCFYTPCAFFAQAVRGRAAQRLQSKQKACQNRKQRPGIVGSQTFLSRGGSTGTASAHNLKVAGSNPAPQP